MYLESHRFSQIVQLFKDSEVRATIFTDLFSRYNNFRIAIKKKEKAMNLSCSLWMPNLSQFGNV